MHASTSAYTAAQQEEIQQLVASREEAARAAIRAEFEQHLASNQPPRNFSSSPRPSPPSKFAGERHLFKEFLFNVEHYFSFYPEWFSSEQRRISFTVALLERHALTWWRYRFENSHLVALPSTWEDFKTDFTDQFLDINHVHQARANMNMLYQKSSVRLLVSTMTTLKMDIPDMNDAEMLDKFMTKVKPEVGKFLFTLAPPPTTFKDASDMAIRYDDQSYFYNSRAGKNKTFLPPSRSGASTSNGSHHRGYNSSWRSDGSGSSTSTSTPMELGASTSTAGHKPSGSSSAGSQPSSGRSYATVAATRVQPGRSNNYNGSRPFSGNTSAPRGAPKWDPIKGPRCFNCNKYGHISSECTAPRRVGN
jgi:hypothetical protein